MPKLPRGEFAASESKSSEFAAWLPVAAWTALIFGSIPLARPLQALARDRLGDPLLVVLALAALAIAAWLGLRVTRRAPSRRARAVLIGVAALYAGAAFALRHRPEESLHLVQYGVLGGLAFRALAWRIRDAAVYLAAACLGFAIGLVDEALQWFTPGRIWDLRDVVANGLAASGVQVALAFGVRPPDIAPRASRSGLRRALGMAALAWLLLAASLLATPPRLAWLARNVPGLAGLAGLEGMLLEYGWLHEVPEIGRFRSRFSLAALRAEDRARGREAGEILAREGDDDRYTEFLRRYSPLRDPFLHEARVHLFRRDRALEEAAERPDDRSWVRRYHTGAWRENHILETYFASTLAHSGRAWSPELRERARTLQRPRSEYTSRVSRELVTRVRERDVLVALGLVGGALLLGRRLCRPRPGPQRAPGSAREAD